MSAPAVTVVMPAYDAERFIGDAVRSVLAQTFADFELLVADDGSTDSTVATARTAANGDARARIIDVPHGGPAKARNAAIREARGATLAFLDADDLWEPDHLAKLVAGMEANPGHFVYSNATKFGDGPEAPAHFPGYAPATSFEDLYLQAHIPSPGAVAVRTADVRAIGGFIEDESCIGSEDRALYLALCAAGISPVYLPHRGVRYRRHAGQLTRRPVKQLRAKLEVRRRYRDAVDSRTGARLVPERGADVLLGWTTYDLAYALLDTDVNEAHARFVEAVALDPALRGDERGARFERKATRARWVTLPGVETLPPISKFGAVVAAACAVVVLGLYVMVRVAARLHGGGSIP